MAILPNSSSFVQGVITEILNPKTALFFLAFIPQFINKDHVVVYQFILLGCIVVGMNTIVDIFVATFSGSFSNFVQKKSRFKRYFQLVPGLGLISLGFFIAFTGERK